MTAAATASEERLVGIPWRALEGLAPDLEAPLAEVLANAPAERVLDRFLRAHRALSSESRLATAEAVFGLGVWRRRLRHHAGDGLQTGFSTRLLLGLLIRDLGRVEEAERILGLAPGSLPSPRPPPEDLATRYSFPDWLAALMEREVGVEAWALADALDSPGPVSLRPNTLLCSPQDLSRLLTRHGITTRPGQLVVTSLTVTSARPNILGLEPFRQGLFEVQDEASQLVGALLDPKPGETVLDLCAGSGGKTLQLAAAVGETGTVMATDIDGRRLERLASRAKRAGAQEIVEIVGGEPLHGSQFDGVLVDAPCSELGALRRGPDRRFHFGPAELDVWPAIQLDLLKRAADHVRPGGRLAYATCTIRREENETVALEFERARPSFERIRLSGQAASDEGFVRTWPHRHGTDGFFGALWRRAV